MDTHTSRPAPSGSPGRSKRPRLSAPTTDEERSVASRTSNFNVIASQNARRASLVKKPQTEEGRRARLVAIKAAMSGPASPSDGARQAIPPSQPRRVNSFQRTRSAEEIKLDRERIIREALGETEVYQGGEAENGGTSMTAGLGEPLATSTQSENVYGAHMGFELGDAFDSDMSFASEHTVLPSDSFVPVQSNESHMDDDYPEPPDAVEVPTTFVTFAAKGGYTPLKISEEIIRKRQEVHQQYEVQELEPRDRATSTPIIPNRRTPILDTSRIYPASSKSFDVKGNAGPASLRRTRTPLLEVNNSIPISALPPALTSNVSSVNIEPQTPLRSHTPVNNGLVSPSGRPMINPAVRALNRNINTPARASGPAKRFVTPFKGAHLPVPNPAPSSISAPQRAIAYGSPSLNQPRQRQAPTAPTTYQTPGSRNQRTAHQPISASVLRDRVFNLEDISCKRLSMRAYGVQPERFPKYQLEKKFKFPADLFQVTTETAIYYAFHTTSEKLDHKEARKELLRLGCHLATQAWVDNHWGLILWKLAGLARACPEELGKWWSWPEVIRQLLYRYEREINRGQRPAIRRIQEQDSPSTKPMVLTVCQIIMGTRPNPDKPEEIQEHPSLVLTDGWYKIQASVDDCLAKAIRLCKIQVGTKIAMAGIRLDAGKEGKEVLKAFDDTSLVLTGNSTSLAPWDAKLGFQRHVSVPTIASLSPTGGMVVMLDVIVTRLYPIGYLDAAVEGEERPAPRCEQEEFAAQDAWEKMYDKEAATIGSEIEERLFNLEALAERLDRGCGYQRAGADSLPGWVDDDLDELEEAPDPKSLIALKTRDELAFLATAAWAKLKHDRDNGQKLVEAELAARCPQRQVRNFQVACVEDARTYKRMPMRTGQLTVWDILSMGDDIIREGKRYLVTSVVPSQKGAWKKPDDSSEIFLQTSRNSRWTPVQ